ncbi:MAG: FprA family A-type flavoprotein [Veillonellaceae bacterium]|nr:FprA family A-type flavoprotein [Veillonellaceae bacterium]
MQHALRLADDFYYLGATDTAATRFENMIPLSAGMSYHSYLLDDEQPAIFDTVDAAVRDTFWQHLNEVLGTREPAYLILNHVEPDHAAAVYELLARYPRLQVVGTKKALEIFEQFYDTSFRERYRPVKSGDVLSLGRHRLRTVAMPMVHWPEVTATYEETRGILFSADAFGSFAPATPPSLYLDTLPTDETTAYLDEARRYYANIIGKYGPQVARALDALEPLDIHFVAPLHGRLLRTPETIARLFDLYHHWATGTAEERGFVIAYASMYGNTAAAVQEFVEILRDTGVTNYAVHDLCATDPSYALADFFRYSHFLLAAPTYNLHLYPRMTELLELLTIHCVRNRSGFIIGNHTWAGRAAQVMAETVGTLTDVRLLAPALDLRSAMKDADRATLRDWAQLAAADLAGVN